MVSNGWMGICVVGYAQDGKGRARARAEARKEGRSGGFVDHGSLPGDVLLDGR